MSQHANSNTCGRAVVASPISAMIAAAERHHWSLHRERVCRMEPGRECVAALAASAAGSTL
jgi:hypothetical protein